MHLLLPIHESRVINRKHPDPCYNQVKYAMARDVRLDDLDAMIDKLGSWASTTQVLLATLEVSPTRTSVKCYQSS